MTKKLHILLADDDKDDCYFFDLILKDLSIPYSLTCIHDGEKLMDYLLKNSTNLPDVLFLDMNMPRKNGMECLEEMKNSNELKKVPVVICSTSIHPNITNFLYDNGAYYYVHKSDLTTLKKTLQRILLLITENKFIRPPKEKFIFNIVENHK